MSDNINKNNIQQPKEPPAPTKPKVIIKVTRENLEAEMEFQHTSSDTLDPVYDDVIEQLREAGVVHGLHLDAIRRMCYPPKYNEFVVIARGKAPQTGQDGWLKYLVSTTRELRPRIREDGTADFKDIGFIQNVLKDQPLCEIHAPEKGEDGMDVYGNLLEGLYGREAQNVAGNNTYYNENKTLLLASCDGNVEVKRGVISVVDVLKIPGSVDNSTGNIVFTGDVMIAGDVVSGFQVESGGSILVRGSVEGATLKAQGDITIGEGMNGMGQGYLVAQGNVKCKYIQSCSVHTGGDIYADTLMYCNVQCGGNVELSGKRAVLIGGKASIVGKLTARTIGTSTHIATEVNMCATGMEKNQEVLDLTQRVKDLDGELTKLIQIMNRYDEIGKKIQLNPEQLEAIQKVKQSYMIYAKQRKDTQARIEALRNEQLNASRDNSYIECKNRVHTGSRITFGPLVMQVSESFVYSRIHVADGEIKIAPL